MSPLRGLELTDGAGLKLEAISPLSLPNLVDGQSSFHLQETCLEVRLETPKSLTSSGPSQAPGSDLLVLEFHLQF